MAVSSVAEVHCIVSSPGNGTNKPPSRPCHCHNLSAARRTNVGLLHCSQSFSVISNNFCIICVYSPACSIHVFLLALSHLACNLKYLRETLHQADHMARGTPAPCSAPAERTVGVRLPGQRATTLPHICMLDRGHVPRL